MKKLATLILSIAVIFTFISCGTGSTQKTIPNLAPDTANVYGPGVDTVISWKVFKAKFHKGKLETCPGEFRQVKWYSIDSTGAGTVKVTLQGPKLTPEELRKMFNPAPITVDDASNSEDTDTVSGSENSHDSSSGFWTSPNWLGIPWWIWLLIAIILLLIIWRLLRGGDNGGTHHTHTHNHTHQYTPYVRQHEQGVGVNQQNATAQSHTEGHSHQTVSSNMPQRYVIRNGRVTINNARGNTQQMDVEINGGEVEINNN